MRSAVEEDMNVTLMADGFSPGSRAPRVDLTAMEFAFSEARPRITRFECREAQRSGNALTLRYAAVADDADVYVFSEHIEIPGSLPDTPVVAGLVRLLGLAASLSYYKAFAPVPYAVPGGLTATERRFLVELIAGGLGEFAIVNNLAAVLDPDVEAPALAEVATGSAGSAPRRALVAVGGGKDSIVSIEALKAARIDATAFGINPRRPIERTAEVAGLALERARRRIDPLLLTLNAEGAPNGHVPVTAINSLIALLTAVATGHDTVVFSNEASASAGNQHWAGRDINHQWSKSSFFEGLLRESVPAGSPEYVSLLRPLTELRIARAFARHTAYHRVFTSCNRAFTMRAASDASWCGECPKCRFVSLILAPFLPRDELLAIFGGRDMFAEAEQREGYLELLGVDGLFKPFECVGEPDECRVALEMMRERDEWAGHPFLQDPDVRAVTATEWERESVFAWRDSEHHLSAQLEEVARAI